MQESQQHSITQLNESFDVFYQQLIYTLIQLSGDSTPKAIPDKVPEDNFEYYQMQGMSMISCRPILVSSPNSNVHLILYGEKRPDLYYL